MMNKDLCVFHLSIQNENGSTMVIALIILVVVTILGIASITTSTTEIAISGNHRLYKIAFYAAEAGRGYVPPNTGLYGGDNIDPDNEAEKIDPDNEDKNPGYFLMTLDDLSFTGDVDYDKAVEPPRGSGYEVSKFRAHKYLLESGGVGPQSTTCTIEAGFYRIGF